MLVRARCQRRGEREPLAEILGEKKQKQNEIGKCNSQFGQSDQWTRKEKASYKPFIQNAPETQGFDKNYGREGSLSPLKFRANISYDGFPGENFRSPNSRASKSPERSRSRVRSLGSNNKKSILKTSKSSRNEMVTPLVQQRQMTSASFRQPNFEQ